MVRRKAWVLVLLTSLPLACSSESGGTGSTGAASAPPVTSASGAPARPNPGASTEPAASVSGSAPAPAPSGSAASAPSGVAVVPPPHPSSSPSATPTSQPVASTAPTSEPSSPPLPAPDPGSADAVAADIDALYANRKTYKAKFHQTYHNHVQGTDKTSDGTVFVERPNKISFRYDPPNQNRIVSDGSVLRVYVADDQQMYENPVKNTEYPGALAFIMGSGIRKSFTFKFNEKAKNPVGPVLFGTPREPTAAYEAVQFYVDKDKLAKNDLGAVVGVTIVDAQHNTNRFEFHDAEEPASIDPSEFTFTPPPGTNVTH